MHSPHDPARTLRIAPALLLASLLLVACSTSGPPPRLREEPSRANATASNPVLRSAGLLREHGEQTGGVDPEVERARLAAHFDRVLEILAAQSEASLERATARLDDPTARDRLALRRDQQIERLRAYRDAGRFPLNEDALAPVQPIFVDDHDTACAVGWLMLQDGWTDGVYAIASRDNHVYVDDVAAGPLLEWVTTSGLTREEAALIQPGYSPPLIGSNTFEALLGGSSFTSAGLRFENFELERVSPTLSLEDCLYFPDDPGCHVPTDPGAIAPFDQIGAAAGAERIVTPNYSEPSTLSNWLYLGDGGDDGQLPRDLMGAHPPTCFDCTSYSAVRVRYDVVAVDPGTGISEAGLYSDPFMNFNRTHAYDNDPYYNVLETVSTLTLRSTLETEGTFLGELILDRGVITGGNGEQQLYEWDSRTFSPVHQLHVDTIAYLLDDNWLTGFFHEFELVQVPEPTTAALLAAGLLGLALRARRPH